MSIQLPDGSILSFSLPQRADSYVIVAAYVALALFVLAVSLPSCDSHLTSDTILVQRNRDVPPGISLRL